MHTCSPSPTDVALEALTSRLSRLESGNVATIPIATSPRKASGPSISACVSPELLPTTRSAPVVRPSPCVYPNASYQQPRRPSSQSHRQRDALRLRDEYSVRQRKSATMKHMSNGFMGSIPKYAALLAEQHGSCAICGKSAGNDTSQLTMSTHAEPSGDSSASSATPPSVSDTDTAQRAPNTSTGYDKQPVVPPIGGSQVITRNARRPPL